MVQLVGQSADASAAFTWSGVPSTQTTASSDAMARRTIWATQQAAVVGTGTVTATVVMEVTDDPLTAAGTNSYWVTLGTITLSGTTYASDGFTSAAPWRWGRARVTAISGTGATLTAWLGV